MMWGFKLLLFWGCGGILRWGMSSIPPLGHNMAVNECANIFTCPDYATCTDTATSYFCTCEQGFQSSNGKYTFQGPGVVCKDIDECQTIGNCPEHSQCYNYVGSYSCKCQAGFIFNGFTCEGVNGCADTSTCPAYATCTDNATSYFCTCKQGFQSSNGENPFQGPGVVCEDIDECVQSPSPCGPYSTCMNMLGRYKCSCDPGFSSPTGNNWVVGSKGQFMCKDIDECQTIGSCPEHSQCYNSMGSYSCKCQAGFILNGSACEDIDECVQSPSPCGPYSTCMNMLGRYRCSCDPGFSSPTGNNWVVGSKGQFMCKDIDECQTIGSCPEHSQCYNSVGSYSCKCQAGFILNGSACEDIDECVQSPSPCGPYSTCMNMLGRYKCSCDLGFSSPTGNNWVVGSKGQFMCKDIDECQTIGSCPEHSQCYNSMGSYSCKCQAGFILNGSACEDIDECDDKCPFNSTCTNTPGSYFCTCRPGFEPSNGQLNFTDLEVECRDADECLQDPTTCGQNAVCTNVPGSYSCSCLAGFQPHPEGSHTYGNFSCKRVPFKCKEDVMLHSEQVQQCHAGAATQPEYVSFCALTNAIFNILDGICENKTTAVSLPSTVDSFSSVLENTSTWTQFSKEKTSKLATVLLDSIESTMLAALLRPSGNASQTIQTEYLDIESKVVNGECHEENMYFNLKAKGDEMRIGCSVIEESESTGMTGVAFLSFAHMELVLDERFFQDTLTSWTKSERKLKMNSRVIGGIMTGDKKENFSNPVIYTLEHIKPKQNLESPICVSWSAEMEYGRWTSSGCTILKASETHTVCSCTHLANLAIIMASGELTMEFSLYIISHMGTIISLVCLVLAITTFLLCPAIQNHNTYLHLHLCICLFLAKLLFLTGIDKTDNQTACSIIAGSLHYLLLACFFWMMVEAVMLFLMVRNLKVLNYFSSRNVKMLHLCLIGYGLPGLVVIISASVQPRGYGMHNRCWLNTETGFIWSFLGPVCMIIILNSILLTWTLWILRQKLSSINSEVSTLKDTRLLTFKAFAQIFILGCSWVLGIFQIGPVASTMAYLFTIINSLQGAFIFLIHCLLNRQVREEYRKCITRNTEPSSQSQTSGILLSSMPSSSKMSGEVSQKHLSRLLFT